MKRRNNISKPSLANFSKPSRVKSRGKRRERYSDELEALEGYRGRRAYNRNQFRGEDLHVSI